ncbi:MAG: hypothetical protein AAF789_07445 [Bacteroidota bacterium]
MRGRTIKSLSLLLLLAAGLVAVVSYDAKDKKNTVERIPFPEVDYWEVFELVRKKRHFVQEVGSFYQIPVFAEELLALEGKDIVLTGYYLPFSKQDSTIIISRFPNSSCFYCGAAGIESVAMVKIGLNPDFRMDDMIIAKGKLLLNDSDLEKLAFILEEATVQKW